MLHKALLDVNICLDVLLDRKPHVTNAGRILEAAEKGKIEAYISSIAFDTLFYIMRSNMEGKEAIRKLRLLRKHIHIAGTDEGAVDHALNSGWGDFEDALHYFSAVFAGCDSIVTRNPADFKAREIPVYIPEEFISEVLS